MSDLVYKLIPQDPFLELTEAQTAQLQQAVAEAAPDATFTETERVQFVDAGAEFHTIHCPFCNSELAPMWWHKEMERIYARAQGFYDLSVTTPCCEQKTTLNDLVYDWPQGFASLVVTTASETAVAALQQATEMISGTPWRLIKARY